MDLTALPKAEIHIHLEGCFDPDDIATLAEACGEPLPRPRDQLYDTSGLTNFLAFLDWTCGLVRTKDQLADAAYRFAARMGKAGVRYADVIVNPTHWAAWRGDIPGMIDALDAGFRAAEIDGLPPARLAISLLRQQSADESIELVDILASLRHPRVAGLSIDGNEAAAGRTGPRFAEAFRRAARHGLRRTAHAGESSGPDGVWDAIDFLGVERIDHGVRAIEDARLVDALIERGISLGVTPSSNITLRLYASLEVHPIDRLRQAGVAVSVNTDDPAPLAIDLPGEYARTIAAFGWDKETVRHVARTSILASFADDDLKGAMLADLAIW